MIHYHHVHRMYIQSDRENTHTHTQSTYIMYIQCCTHEQVYISIHNLHIIQINGLMHAYEDCLYLTIERKRPLSATTSRRISGGGNSPAKPVPLPRKNIPSPIITGDHKKETPPVRPKPTITPRRGVTSPNRPTQSLNTYFVSDIMNPEP